MNGIIRTVEGGGSGFRRVDVFVDDSGYTAKCEPVVSEKKIRSPEDLLHFVIEDLDPHTTGIAYSLAGFIHAYSLVVNSPNLQFLNGADLGQKTHQITRLPVYVANDMEAATLGIYTLMSQAGTKLDNFVAITWSSGIGVRFCINGVIPFSSEAGHLVREIHQDLSLQCGCGKYGCTESIIGGEAVERWLFPLLDGIGDPGKRPLARLDEGYMSEDVQIKKKSTDFYRTICWEMGLFLAQLKQINTDFTAVVWKGTLALRALALPGIEESIRGSMRINVMDESMEREVAFHLISDIPGWTQDQESFYGSAKLLSDTLDD